MYPWNLYIYSCRDYDGAVLLCVQYLYHNQWYYLLRNNSLYETAVSCEQCRICYPVGACGFGRNHYDVFLTGYSEGGSNHDGNYFHNKCCD